MTNAGATQPPALDADTETDTPTTDSDTYVSESCGFGTTGSLL